MSAQKKINTLAINFANHLFELLLDVKNQGVNYTWEIGARMAGEFASNQLHLSYARAPKNLQDYANQAKSLAETQFRKRMAQYEGVLPLHSESKACAQAKP